MRAAAEDYGIRRVGISFHGGEPLLVKPRVLDRYCELLTSATAGVCDVEFGMQTNGVLIDSEWIDLIARHRIGVGVSMDGPAEIHDRNRVDHKGRGSYAAAARGFAMLRDAAAAGRIPAPGLLCVVGPAVSGDGILRHFVDVLGAENVNFLLPDLKHDDPVVTVNYLDDVAHYLRQVVDGWAIGARGSVRVRFIREIVGALLNDDISNDAVSFKEDYRNLLTVSSNGDIAPEDTLRALAPRFANTGLNVATHRLQDVFASPVWRELGAAREQLPSRCSQCRWWAMCKGGKPYNRFTDDAGFSHPTLFCDPLQQTYEHVFALLERIGRSGEAMQARLDAGRARAGLPPLERTQEICPV